MQKLVFIKFGGSLITDKNIRKKPQKKVIKRLSQELAEAQKKLSLKLLVGNGGGSFSHPPSQKYQIPLGVINQKSLTGISEVQDLGSQLNRIIVRALINAGINAISINPSSVMISANSKVKKSYLKPLIAALKIGMTPVVYGDVIFDEALGCADISTEKIFTHLQMRLKKLYRIEKIIYCGKTDGVYGPNDITIPKISNKNFPLLKTHIGLSGSPDTTGGMLHKVSQCLKLTEKGVKSLIINAAKENNLLNALMDKKFIGTEIS